ncbi:MAG: DUF455 domain-containing protein [Dehalococcoidia bacterium]
MSRLRPGDVLEALTLHGGAADEVRPWVRVSGHSLVAQLDAGADQRWLIQCGPAPFDIRQAPSSIGSIAAAGKLPTFRDWITAGSGPPPDKAPAYFGFIPRGATAPNHRALPTYPFALNRKDDTWAANLGDLYDQATAQQWQANRDIPWAELPELAPELERATCQLMTFLAENEYSALYIPAKFLPRVNARYLETVLFLGTVIADEARHIEVFTKRALANGMGHGFAAPITEWSLQTLFLEEDYFRSSFLLHVLGEGTFLDLLEFIERHAPDAVTREIMRRARADEGRHVAYGVAHVRHVLEREPARSSELIEATEARSAALAATSGDNPIVLEALAILAGGGDAPAQFAAGLDQARGLYREMDANRVRRMLQIGLDLPTAQAISAMHSPNFM